MCAILTALFDPATPIVHRGAMEDDIRLPQIIDSLSAPIAIMTAEGRFDLANKEFLDYLGMSVDVLKDWETSGVVYGTRARIPYGRGHASRDGLHFFGSRRD